MEVSWPLSRCLRHDRKARSGANAERVKLGDPFRPQFTLQFKFGTLHRVASRRWLRSTPVDNDLFDLRSRSLAEGFGATPATRAFPVTRHGSCAQLCAPLRQRRKWS